MITIGIVTFSKREESFTRLICDIRKATDRPVIVCINGNLDGSIDHGYLSRMMALCGSHNDVFPMVFPRFQGLSKLWNTICINATTEYTYLLNDDVVFGCPDVVDRIERHIDATGSGLFYAPWGWSHFVISRKVLREVGYFDERLIGVGEEDGDFLWRFERLYGFQPTGIEAPGLHNAYDYRNAHDGIDTYYGNKTRFNTQFIYGAKYRPDEKGQRSMFNYPVSEEVWNAEQYPYEDLNEANRKWLADASDMPLKYAIDPEKFRYFKPWVSE